MHRHKSDENLTFILEEINLRDKIYALQKLISNTSVVMSEERNHYMKLWRENDELKIAKSKVERKIADLVSICNPNENRFSIEENKNKKTEKFTNKNTLSSNSNTHKVNNINNSSLSKNNNQSSTAIGYYTRNIGNLVEKPRNLIRTVYLPNQETIDMKSEIDELKNQILENRNAYENQLNELKEEKRQYEELHYLE